MAITFTRRQLGRRLKRLRIAAKLSLRQVTATQIIGSTKTLQRLESGLSTSMTFPVIRDLGALYGAPPALCEELVAMFKAADRPWGDDFTKSVIKGFSLFTDLERMANVLLIFEPNLVTGLLQTDDYGKELHRRHGGDDDTIASWTKIRKRRLDDFWALDPLPQVRVLMGEWALPNSDPKQMARLAEASAEIRIMPTAGTPYAYFRGPFTILTFPDELGEPDCVYTETLEGSRYEEGAETAAIYHQTFEEAFRQARPIEEF